MKNFALALVVVAVSLGGCANLTPGEQRAATGTGIGAAGGAVLGALGGNAALGAGVGAAAGLAGGLLVNSWKNNEHESYQRGYYNGQRSQY
ncbi:glycine zipper family protein [Rhodopila sp.]|uniref:glycine zipper family protein n=1 Tax=Rhodopila sp. TaxID=2480087 RepID=UPI003D1384E0